ncbi:MAG: hypothetical protein IJW52_01035 [Clostridia bacterium]|nr:hypothetical protein [Clostridia bacterium]
MKNVFKRLLSLLLALSFICIALIACGNNANNGENKSSENATNSANATQQMETNAYGEPSFTSSITYDNLDFEGETITILGRGYLSNTREWYKEHPEDELDEAIAMRNEAVSEALNVDVQFEWIPSNGQDYNEFVNTFFQVVTQDVVSGMHYYDISASYAYPTASSTIRDYTTNLKDKDLFPYFDFSLPCWNQAIVTNTTFNEQLFYVAGDINLSMFDAAMVVWHNKTLFDENREATDPENMQELALEGYWTYDELYRWTSVFYEDSNGTAGRQEDDTYALMASNVQPCPIDAFPYAWDLEFVIENNDQTHSFNIVGNDRAERALTKFRNLANGTGTSTSWSAKVFAAGHAMFYMERIFHNYDSNMAIREMEDKYGLLPMPKFDAEQEQYATTAQDYYNLMFVLDHAESSVPTKGEAISAYLQLATEESYTGVRGYYFNRIIKPKFFGTDDSEGTVTNSIALFDIIVSNIKFDYCYIYSMQLSNINHLWRDAGRKNAGSLESFFLSKQSSFENAIAQTDEWLGLRTLD